MATTAAEVLIDTLEEWGVSVIFGMPGDGINGIMEALRTRQDRIRFVQVRHEESAAFMACGYAKFTGKLGVCLATAGPGGVHLLNGLYDAKLDGQPVLAITGMPYHDLIGTHTQQDIELDRVFADVAQYSIRIMGAAHVESVTHLACRTALSYRTVSHITFPVDLQEHEVKGERSKRNVEGHASEVYAQSARLPDERDLQRAAAIVNAGKKVVILAGRGALGAGAELEQVSASRISSRQASDFFLCADCEDRFSKRGETWVLANCWRDEKTFQLRDALLASTPLDGSTTNTKIYLGEHIPGVDPDKLAYFGASVFWRGAARSWQIEHVRVPRLPFNRYEELFRLFLLDKGLWPDKAVMYIFVGAGMESMRNNIVQIPAKISTNGSYIYRFRIPGITYLLLLGERFKKYRSMCNYHAKGRPIYIMDANDQWNFQDAMHEYANSPRKGVLKGRLDGPDATPLNWPDEVLRRLLPPRRKT